MSTLSAHPWTRWVDRLLPPPEALPLLLAVAIGGGTGVCIVGFHYLFTTLQSLLLDRLLTQLAPWGFWTLALIPTLGGLGVGLMRQIWQGFGPNMSGLIAQARGQELPQPLRTLPKLLAVSLSLGSGASLGPEGPSVEIGGNIGLLLAQRWRMSQDRQLQLLAAGAAAGLAAGFNAPVAGVFFALEVVMASTAGSSAVSMVLLAAVISALVAQIGLGSQPAFDLPAYEVRSPLELPLYLGLGILASLISWLLTQALTVARQAYAGELPGLGLLARIPRWLQPLTGGLCVGLIALQLPQILGIGYETLEALLRDQPLPLATLATLLFVKLAATAISSGSGLVGGVFAPSLFLGAMLGSAYGKLMGLLLPLNVAAPPAYAMVGMAAVLAGTARAPLTAILLLFEMTRDYRIVLPLMAAAGLSAWLTERLRSLPSTDLSGLPTPSLEQDDITHQLRVRDLPLSHPLLLSSSLSLALAAERLLAQGDRAALVVESEQLIGLLTLDDLQRGLARGEETGTVPALGDVINRDLIYTRPEETLAEAIARMSPRGLVQLPVLDLPPGPVALPLPSSRLLGLVTRDGIDLGCSQARLRDALQILSLSGNQTA